MAKSSNEIQRIATEVAAQLAATAQKTASNLSSVVNPDHELLIRMDEKLAQVIKDVADIKTNTMGRIDALEVQSINKQDHKEVVDDINMLKSWRSYMLGAIAIIGIVVPFVITYEMSK